MPFSYELTYGGVGFCIDAAQTFRMFHKKPEQQEDDSEKQAHAPRKFQPIVDLIEELDRRIPFKYMKDFSPPSSYPGRNLGSLAYKCDVGTFPDPEIRIGEFYYPNTASRWSVFRGLASSSQVSRMLDATEGNSSATFRMVCMPEGARHGSSLADHTLETDLYMLPPRCLSDEGGEFDGLYLVTLVDERYYWSGIPVKLHIGHETSWLDLITNIANALEVSINLQSSIPSEYLGPEIDSQLWCNFESASVLLDAVAYNVGKTLVRNLDGTYVLYTPGESLTLSNTNRSDRVNRTAGGEFFYSGTNLKTGTTTTLKNGVVPEYVNVSYPKYIVGDDPVPHFLNPRYRNQRPSSWFEDSYGETCLVSVPITSGGSSVSGLTGYGEDTLRNTAKALYSGEIACSGQPMNYSGLVSLSMKLVQDHYSRTVMGNLDEVYPGIINFFMEGLHDVVWTYSARSRLATTRMFRSSWNASVENFQHRTPSISGSTSTPKGVGGPTVAQTIRSDFLSGGFTHSGFTYHTTLSKQLSSGDMQASFTDVSYFPTQNRWKAVIWGTVKETVLFEGTSGGIIRGGVLISGTPGTSGGLVSGGPFDFFTSSSGGDSYTVDPFGGFIIANSGSSSPGETSLGGYITLNSGDTIPSEGMLIEEDEGEEEGEEGEEEIVYNSGVIVSGTMTVDIAWRAIDGSLPNTHPNGTSIRMLAQQASYGVNLTTTEKGQYIYPAEWTSGGVQGVNIVPQTQTVEVLSDSPLNDGGYSRFSGCVTMYKANAFSGGHFNRKEFVWVVGRNGQSLKKGFYDGQLMGYSFAFSGSVTAPVYAVGNKGDGAAVIDSDYLINNLQKFEQSRRDEMIINDEQPGFITNRHAGIFAHTIRVTPFSGYGSGNAKSRLVSIYPATVAQGRFIGDSQIPIPGAVVHSEQHWHGVKNFKDVTVHDEGVIIGSTMEVVSGKGNDWNVTNRITAIGNSGRIETYGDHLMSVGDRVQIFGVHTGNEAFTILGRDTGLDVFNTWNDQNTFENFQNAYDFIVSEVPGANTFYVTRVGSTSGTNVVPIPKSGVNPFDSFGRAGVAGGFVRRVSTVSGQSIGNNTLKRPRTGVHLIGNASHAQAIGLPTNEAAFRAEIVRGDVYRNYLFVGENVAGNSVTSGGLAFEVGRLTNSGPINGGISCAPSMQYVSPTSQQFYAYLGDNVAYMAAGLTGAAMYFGLGSPSYYQMNVGINTAQLELIRSSGVYAGVYCNNGLDVGYPSDVGFEARDGNRRVSVGDNGFFTNFVEPDGVSVGVDPDMEHSYDAIISRRGNPDATGADYSGQSTGITGGGFDLRQAGEEIGVIKGSRNLSIVNNNLDLETGGFVFRRRIIQLFPSSPPMEFEYGGKGISLPFLYVKPSAAEFSGRTIPAGDPLTPNLLLPHQYPSSPAMFGGFELPPNVGILYIYGGIIVSGV